MIHAPVDSATYPRPLQAWWLIAILFLASVVSVIDRSILSIIVDPVKADLSLTDIHISLLQGLAFGLFYATVGLPLGLTADRTSRRTLIIAGVTVWSLATIGGGLAQSFAPLFVSRLLVGLGEAALAPAAISLIADLFPPDRRGRPISIFLIGQAIANGLAISITSLIVAAAAAGKFAHVPLLSHLPPWRIAFVCCGLMGFLVVAAMLTTREPQRQSLSQQIGVAAQIRLNIDYLSRNRAVFVPLYLGFALCFLAGYAGAGWAPAMLMRGFGATSVQIGKWLGPLSMLFSVVGPTIGGILVDRYARRGNDMAKLVILSIAPLCVIPSALAVFAPNLASAVVLVASSGAVFAIVGTTMFALLQVIVPPDMRGVSVALTGLVNTIIGATLGPLLVAALTERVFADPAKVGFSIFLVVVPALLLAVALFAAARRALLAQRASDGEVGRLMQRR
jgi:MFS family permease